MAENRYNILIVEDDFAAGKVITGELVRKGYVARCFENAEEALIYFSREPVDLVLVDYSLPGMSGEEFFIKVKELHPLVPVIFITALQSVDKAVQLLQMGAYSYLTKPVIMKELHHNIEGALEKVKLHEENRRLDKKMQETFAHGDYVFHSPRMQELLKLVLRAAGSLSNILITGESGTGKDVVTNIVHLHSPRKDEKLVKVNLSALPATLLESELFGVVKGAYTGAIKDRPGKFEDAHKGTLFLDEIGELPPDAQVKLLRVIQDREITRLGSNTPVKTDIRLVTATNQDLRALVKEKKFRQDLFYRLNVINIELPPLRERKEDIPPLIYRFIRVFNNREGKQVKEVSKDVLNCLMKYPFPGNIRELENIIERALVLTQNDIVCTEDLPLYILNPDDSGFDEIAADSPLPLPERLAAIEKRILEKTLKKNRYHQSNTAKELGISESRLRYKIQTLGIQKKL